MDPQSVEALVNHGMLLYYKHDWNGARRMADQALAMQPGSGFALRLRSRVAEAEGRYEEALADAREAKRLAGDGWVNLEVVIVRLQFLAGHTADARRALAALEQARLEGREHVRARDLAYIYTAQGRHADALDQFERALDERDPSLVWLTVEPRVDPLRSDPRFQAILQRIGLN
jgi:tetratricopeptide (TPR) repeat protein